MAGRDVNLTNGGIIRLFESTEQTQDNPGGGKFKGEIRLDNLSADRVYTLPDQDCTLGGLAPGEYWATELGGTGRNNLPQNRILFGTDQAPVGLIAAPTTNNTFLAWDSVQQTFTWNPILYQGLEQITASNYDTNLPGPYANKIGTQLYFKNFKGQDGVTISQDTTSVTIGYDTTNIPVSASQITDQLSWDQIAGNLPVNRGSTGITSPVLNGVMVGTAGAWQQLPAPTTAGQRLSWNGTNIVWDTVPLKLKEHESGELDYVDGNDTYTLCLYFSYNADINNFVFKTRKGSISFNVFVGGQLLGSYTANSSSKQIVNFTDKTISVGAEITIVATNSTGDMEKFAWTFGFTRH